MLRAVILSGIGQDQGITITDLEFSQTPSGKPYLVLNPHLCTFRPHTIQVSPSSLSFVGFNVSHDNAVVLMGISESHEFSGTPLIGVDIMKTEIPADDDLPSFIASVESTVSSRSISSP